MRHRDKGIILGRKTGPRKLLLRNLATSIILYEKVKTTSAKARAVRPLVERLITKSKNDSVHVRRQLAQKLLHKNAVKKAVEVLGPRYKERQGGYTRTIKLGARKGDSAEMVQFELV